MMMLKILRGMGLFFFFLAAVSASAAGEAHNSNPDSSGAILFLDFEDGELGTWTPRQKYLSTGRGLLLMEIVPATEYNHSSRVLFFTPAAGDTSGRMYYYLEKNGINPPVLTSDLQVAWAWNVSRIDDMNGVWLCLVFRDTRNCNNYYARVVNYVKHMHDWLAVYYDPPLCWCYHCEGVFDFIWRRYGPFQKGDILLEGFYLEISNGIGVKSWMDNIWIGYGEPPPEVNNISDSSKVEFEIPSPMTGFSYCFIDHNDIPDRVEVYRERSDIFLNPHYHEGAEIASSIRTVRRAPDITIDFNRQRGDGVVTPADLDGDGHTDLIFHFDDKKGNLCFKNDYLRGGFREIPVGALACKKEHGCGSVVADIDGDTDLDVFMYNGFRKHGMFGGVRMFRNEGRFHFTDWTENSYLLSEGSFGGIFSDLNGDGLADLFVNYKPLHSGLRPFVSFGNGEGVFSPSLEALADSDSVHYNSFTASDFDNDADIDIYCVSNYIMNSARGSPSAFFRNEGDGTFTDITDSTGAWYRDKSNVVTSGDFNLDGRVDIYLSNRDGSSYLFINQGDNRFGKSDKYTSLFCEDPLTAITPVDFDLDGDLDLVMLTADERDLLIRENIGKPDNFLEVRLRGSGNNRFGIGGRVYIYEEGYLNDREHLLGYREILSGAGSKTKTVPVAHFGLGNHTRVDLKVVFPPGAGERPVVRTRKSVGKASFLTICQQEGFPESLFCGIRTDYLRDSLIYFLFRIPLWFLVLLVFIAAVSTGIWIRDAVGRTRHSPGRIAAAVLAAILSALLIYRSPVAGAAVIIASAVIVLFLYRIEEVLRAFMTSTSRREKLEELLFDDLSQAIHTEKKFSFLGDMARSDSSLDRDQIRDDFKSMEAMVSTMRVVSPSKPEWRAVREQVAEIRNISERLLSEESDKGEAKTERSIFRHALEMLNSMLDDYRMKMRMKYSVKFMEEWKSLTGEYRERLREDNIELTADFPGDLEGRRVHLLPEEFRHIFKNLLDNSIHALRDSDVNRIRVGGRYEADYLVIRWQDTGPGLSPEVEEEIFISPVSSDKPGGRGEGCYQSGRIIRRRGGRIRAEAGSGISGADFVLKIIVF